METISQRKALLALEDGTLFYGYTHCEDIIVCSEVVFNTAMTGYQEICTDPSYANQIVLFTTSHVGNVGVNQYDNESKYPALKGIIVKEMAKRRTNIRSEEDVQTFLKRHNIPWIEGIDTRKLTRHLRDFGSKKGCIMIGRIDPKLAVQFAKDYVNKKENLVPFLQLGRLELNPILPTTTSNSLNNDEKIVYLYDFGVKSNIVKMLENYGCKVRIIPPTYPINKVLDEKPNGVVLSNGPGDPAALTDVIQQVRLLVHSGIPTLGICLGCQLIGLASGAKTKKMQFGHHGANHPVYSYSKKKVFITSQNHNYVIDETTLPNTFEITHVSLFDGTIQGIRSKKMPVTGFQGHPEGSPGPQDIVEVFEKFLNEMENLCL